MNLSPQELFEKITKSLVLNPDSVRVSCSHTGKLYMLNIEAAESDYGNIIGKDGRTVRSMHCIARKLGQKAKEYIRVHVVEKQPMQEIRRYDPIPYLRHWDHQTVLQVLRDICGECFDVPAQVEHMQTGGSHTFTVGLSPEEPIASFEPMLEWTTKRGEKITISLLDAIELLAHNMGKAQGAKVHVEFFRPKNECSNP